MKIQEILHNAVKAQRAEEMKSSIQIMLGELILKLETLDENLSIYFDNQKYRPSGIESWRGSYDEMAITYKGGGSINSNEVEQEYKDEQLAYMDLNAYKPIDTTMPEDVKVKDLLGILKISIGKTMTGYKGGNFLIGKTTPIWVANYGSSVGYKTNKNYDSQAVVEVALKANKAILVTKLLSY